MAAPAEALAGHAAASTVRRHSLAASAEDADLILFSDAHLLPHDPGLRAIRRHPLLQAFKEKTLVYDERDLPWLAWPGIYVSMPRRHLRPAFQEPWAYYTTPTPAPLSVDAEPDLLFSFVGSPSHPVRRRVVALRHPRGVVRDVRKFTFFDESSPGFDDKRAVFREMLQRSKFVLCPRGRGTSSIRLYETLAAGRVPVIVSDDWAAPAGPDWASFSLTCAERDVPSLPRILEQREGDYERLAAAARAAFDEWFAPSVAFARIVDRCERLLEQEAPLRFPVQGFRDRRWVVANLDHARWCGVAKAKRMLRAPGRLVRQSRLER